jgi:hypothetical protein
MKWELGALKILARNPTVPGIALRDAIEEIELLTGKSKACEWEQSAVNRFTCQAMECFLTKKTKRNFLETLYGVLTAGKK